MSYVDGSRACGPTGFGLYRIIHELRADRTARVLVIRHRASAFDTDPGQHNNQAATLVAPTSP